MFCCSQYLLSFATAGSGVQFYGISPCQLMQPYPISPLISMSTAEGRAQLALCCVKVGAFLNA